MHGEVWTRSGVWGLCVRVCVLCSPTCSHMQVHLPGVPVQVSVLGVRVATCTRYVSERWSTPEVTNDGVSRETTGPGPSRDLTGPRVLGDGSDETAGRSEEKRHDGRGSGRCDVGLGRVCADRFKIQDGTEGSAR